MVIKNYTNIHIALSDGNVPAVRKKSIFAIAKLPLPYFILLLQCVFLCYKLKQMRPNQVCEPKSTLKCCILILFGEHSIKFCHHFQTYCSPCVTSCFVIHIHGIVHEEVRGNLYKGILHTSGTIFIICFLAEYHETLIVKGKKHILQ